MSDSRRYRLVIVEEALKTKAAHFYEYVKSVAALNATDGGETLVVSHAETEAAIIRELDAYPLFKRSNWDGVYNHRQAWRRYWGIVKHNWLVYRVMSRFVKQHDPIDLLFAPTVVIHHIFGWRLLMWRHPRRIRQMVLLFRNNAGSYPDGSSTPLFKRSTKILKWALQSFRGLIASDCVRFATDSARLAREYKLLSGIEPEVWPSPRIAPFEPLKKTAPKESVTFACLGPARFEKGIDVMQAAIKRHLAANPNSPARFVIQWNAPILDEHGVLYNPDPDLRADSRVAFIEKSMSSEEYDAVVAATDVMLLPYRRASYFARISGVAVEAVTAGIPLIYTYDTWNADLVDQCGAGISVGDGDVAALSEAIGEMAKGYTTYRGQALARATEARRLHSGEAFLAKLKGDV